MNKIDPTRYRTILFDCDGVLLNSNNIKTQAFFHATKSYGEKAAQCLVQYHLKNGGISRYKKFEFFLREIVKTKNSEIEMKKLLELFSQQAKKETLTCLAVQNLNLLKKLCETSIWGVVSGSDQLELQETLEKRDLARYFDMGIFGSPDTKEEIVEKHINNRPNTDPVLYIGDSKYDFDIARKYDFEFLFVSDWSEWTDWYDYQEIYKFESIKNLDNWILSEFKSS